MTVILLMANRSINTLAYLQDQGLQIKWLKQCFKSITQTTLDWWAL